MSQVPPGPPGEAALLPLWPIWWKDSPFCTENKSFRRFISSIKNQKGEKGREGRVEFSILTQNNYCLGGHILTSQRVACLQTYLKTQGPGTCEMRRVRIFWYSCLVQTENPAKLFWAHRSPFQKALFKSHPAFFVILSTLRSLYANVGSGFQNAVTVSLMLTVLSNHRRKLIAMKGNSPMKKISLRNFLVKDYVKTIGKVAKFHYRIKYKTR